MSEVRQRGTSCFAAAVASVVDARFDQLPADTVDPDRFDVWANLDRWLRSTRGHALTLVRHADLERPTSRLQRFLTGRGVELDPALVGEPPRFARERSGGLFVVLLERGGSGHAAVGQAQAGAVRVVHDPASYVWRPGARAADVLFGLVFVVGASGLPEPSPWESPPCPRSNFGFARRA